MMPKSESAGTIERRKQRRLFREERAASRLEEDRLFNEDNKDSSGAESLPSLPAGSESDDDEEEKKKKKEIDKVAISLMAKQLSKEMVLAEGKFSRSKLPKLEYSKMIFATIKTFPQWLKQLKVIAYSRRWPDELTQIGETKWNMKEDSSDESMARREAYQYMEQSIPQENKYIIEFVKPGDAQAIYNNLWQRFYKTTPLTIGIEVGLFWSLSQKGSPVDVFAAEVHTSAEKLVAAGKDITDQEKATVFIGGLISNKEYILSSKNNTDQS